jgi:hypothetical protein
MYTWRTRTGAFVDSRTINTLWTDRNAPAPPFQPQTNKLVGGINDSSSNQVDLHEKKKKKKKKKKKNKKKKKKKKKAMNVPCCTLR